MCVSIGLMARPHHPESSNPTSSLPFSFYQAERDVDELRAVLDKQNIDLKLADKAAQAMLDQLEVGAREAGIKKEEA